VILPKPTPAAWICEWLFDHALSNPSHAKILLLALAFYRESLHVPVVFQA
jgi:hypothetical protein